MNKKFSAEQIIKGLSKIARTESVEMAAAQLENEGNYHDALVVKSFLSTSDVTGGVSPYDALLPLIERKSLIGQINSIKPFFEVPKNTRILFGSNPQAGFVLESAPCEIVESDLETVQLVPKTVRCISLITAELARTNAEHLLSRALIGAAALAESSVFASTAAATGAAPAGIFAGISALPGTTSLINDFATLVASFDGDLSSSVLVVSPLTAIKMASVWPTAGIGGDVGGLAIAAHSAVDDGMMGLVQPSRVMLADDGIDLDIAKDTSLTVTRDVDGVPVSGELSCFQMNLLALKITRRIDFLAPDDSVAYITGGTY